MKKRIWAALLLEHNDIAHIEWDDFDVSQCLRGNYKPLDKALAANPGGFAVVFKRKPPLIFRPGVLLGSGLQYTNFQGSWHIEQPVWDDATIEAEAEAVVKSIKNK